MKKYAISFVILTLLRSTCVLADSITEAITSSELLKVKSELSNRNNISTAEKEILLKHAEYMVKVRKNNVPKNSLLNSQFRIFYATI